MLAISKCAGCILDDISGALELLNVSEETKEKVILKILDYLGRNFNFSTVPSVFITNSHRILKNITQISVPFSELREKCNIVGMQIAEKVKSETRNLSDNEKIKTLIKWAVTANHLDFRTVGTGYGFKSDEIFSMLRIPFREGLNVDNTDTIIKALTPESSVLFIHDNVGEIAFDALLISALRAKGLNVTSALRGGPITSDATLKDGMSIGLDKISDKIILAGPDTLGISWEEMSEELRDALNTSKLIFSKGQANYYVLSEHCDEIQGKIICLLRTKCSHTTNSFGFTGKSINVATLL